jgi:hypothetical protein
MLFTDENKKAFLEQLAKCCSVMASAQAIGIDRTTVYLWLEKDPAFAKAFHDTMTHQAGVAIDTLYTRALQLLGKGGPINANAGRACLELWMRNQGMLVEKHEVDIGKVEISFSPETDKEPDA